MISLVEFSKQLLIERLKGYSKEKFSSENSHLTGHDVGLQVSSLPIMLPSEETVRHWSSDVAQYKSFAEDEYGNVGEGNLLVQETVQYAMRQLFSFSDTALDRWNEPSDWAKLADGVQEDLKTFHQFLPAEIL